MKQPKQDRPIAAHMLDEGTTMSNPIRYFVQLTITGRTMYVRNRPDWDGSWYTRQLRDAKAWKTRRGAQRWVDEHSYERSCLHASVHEVV